MKKVILMGLETVHFQHFPYDFFWILCLYILAFLNNHLSFSPI